MSDNEYESLKLENQLCFPLYACSKEVIRRYKPYLDKLDLTYTQYIAMMVMWERNLIVSITQEGEELKKQAVQIPASLGACVNVEPQEAQQLYQLLYKLLDGLS